MKFGYLIEPPFNYRLADGTVTGCDVELAKAMLAHIGENNFEPVETEFAELLPGVAAGRWRMTTGLFATEERKKIAIFSRPSGRWPMACSCEREIRNHSRAIAPSPATATL